MNTHYETYAARINPHREQARKCIKRFQGMTTPMGDARIKIAENSGHWFTMVLEKQGVVRFPDGETYKFQQNSLDALSIELYSMWYSEGRSETQPLSLMTTLLTNIDWVVHQSFLNDLIGIPASQTTAEVAYQLLSHERAGKRVYEVTSGLAEKLKHTELRGLRTDDVRLPHPNIYITVPENVGFKVYNLQTGWHDLVGVYITEDKEARKEPTGMKVEVKQKARCITTEDNLKFKDRPVVREWCMMFVGAPAKDANGNVIKGDDALFYFRLYLPEEQTIDDAVNEVIVRYSSQVSQAKETYEEIAGAMDDTWPAVFNWCLNVIIYATYSEPGEEMFGNPEARKLWDRIRAAPEGSRTRKNLTDKASGIDPRTRIVLGKHILIDRSRPEPESDSKRPGKPLTVRTRVTGHWRKQAFGKQRSERRMQWIEPFWRGPELGTETNKRHVLK